MLMPCIFDCLAICYIQGQTTREAFGFQYLYNDDALDSSPFLPGEDQSTPANMKRHYTKHDLEHCKFANTMIAAEIRQCYDPAIVKEQVLSVMPTRQHIPEPKDLLHVVRCLADGSLVDIFRIYNY